MLSNEQLAIELLKIQVQQGKITLDAVLEHQALRSQVREMRRSIYTPDITGNTHLLLDAFNIILSEINEERASGKASSPKGA